MLLAVACLGVTAGPVATALAQGAGDQQYQDPFGGDDSGSGNSDNNSGGSGSNSGGGDVEPLTPAPQTSGGGSSSGSGSSSPSSGAAGPSSSGTTTTAPAATLPNTGLDTRVLVIGGAVLLLLGLGLRLRNAPERF